MPQNIRTRYSKIFARTLFLLNIKYEFLVLVFNVHANKTSLTAIIYPRKLHKVKNV